MHQPVSSDEQEFSSRHLAWNGLKTKSYILQSNEMSFADNTGLMNKDEQEKSKDDNTLGFTYYCTRLRDKINLLMELKPLEPPLRNIFCKREELPRIPMRLVCVIDVSHSMAEPYGTDPTLSKLDKVKLFAKLLVNTIGHEDHLAIVIFGTTAEVIAPLKKMSTDVKQQTLAAIDMINLKGVTNMSAGVFAAIDQFNIAFAKSRNFNDNILLFTDGMANEGITVTNELIREIRKKIKLIREECHFEQDYSIKFATVGTCGFLPELLFNIGQTFSSDAFFHLSEQASMELDLMLPILLKQNTAVANINLTITTLNGVQLEMDGMTREYLVKSLENRSTANQETSVQETFFIYDIALEMSRHIMCCLKLPKKHKKVLKGKEILKIEISYKDSLMCSRTLEKVVYYHEIPAKENKNVEFDVVESSKQISRIKACQALDKAAVFISKLDRSSAKIIIDGTINDLQCYGEGISNDFCTSEESHIQISDWIDIITANLECCKNFIGDFAVRWDDAWGRIRALESSLMREVPSSSGIYANRKELFSSPKIKDKIQELLRNLKDIYANLGLSSETLDQYQTVIVELEMKLSIHDNEEV